MRWRPWSACLVAAALVTCAGCTPTGNGNGGNGGDGNTITGSVVDASDPNTGVSDAYVYVAPRGGTRSVPRAGTRQSEVISATTDALGQYSLTGVPEGLQKIVVEPPADSDYPPFDLEVEVSAERATQVRATQSDAFTAARVADLTVEPETVAMATGGTQQFTASVLDADGAGIGVTPTWVALGGIGTVSENGLFTAGSSSGRGLVMALLAGRAALAAVAVGDVGPASPPAIESLTVNPGQRVHDGDAVTLDCVYSNPGGEALTWSWLATGSPVEGDGAHVTWVAPEAPGRYAVTCIIRNSGGSDRRSVTIWVLPPAAENGLIAFTSSRNDRTQVWVMDPDGSNQVAISQYPAQSPAIAPDGVTVAYSYLYQIWTVKTDGTGPATHVVGGLYEEPSWAPARGLLALRSDALLAETSSIGVAGPGGLTVLNITDGSHRDRTPRWSPEGLRIAFVSDRNGNDEIYTMYANGADPVRVTNSVATEKSPCWSPDGTRIAFASNRTGNYEIFVVNADGSSPVNLTQNAADDVDPCFSPDGAWLVFASNRGAAGTMQIYRTAVDASAVVQLTDSAGESYQPHWGPAP